MLKKAIELGCQVPLLTLATKQHIIPRSDIPGHRPMSFPYLKTILCESIYIRKCKWYTVRILIYNSGSNYIIAIMLTAAILRIWTTVMITRVGEIRVSKFNARKRITRKMMIMIATKITIAIVRIILKKRM